MFLESSSATSILISYSFPDINIFELFLRARIHPVPTGWDREEGGVRMARVGATVLSNNKQERVQSKEGPVEERCSTGKGLVQERV